LEGGQESRNMRSSIRGRPSISHVDQFDALSQDNPMGLATASFRTVAMARNLVSKSRRSHLRQSIRESIQVGELPEDSELTPLRKQIPEDGAPPEYDTVEALKSIVLGKPVSILLLLAPFAIWSHYGGWGAEYIFWLNFGVMIPLASILGDFTEEAALHTNETIGGLLNATFGNAVEVVVGIQALLANEIRVVQASMIGSIFSNLLLVLGCCFFFGGLYYKEQVFNSTAATANMGLLALSSIALVLPTPFADYYNVQDEHVLIISRIAAIFLLFMYIQLLIFQLYTHKDIFDEVPHPKANGDTDDEEDEEDETAEERGEEEEPSISMAVALIGLCITTLSITVFSDFLVGSIDEFCESSGISRTFVGLIILPIVGNAVEHITAVTVAMKNKMDLAMGGTSIGNDRMILSP
jgi:Ca2+:H+ antiporter